MQRKHCHGLTCEDGGAGDDCGCSCDGRSTCSCGCMEPRRQGFESTPVQGIYKGRGAGYQLVRRKLGWDVIDEKGRSIYAVARVLATSLDAANMAATKHAREAGHGHP